MGNIGSVANAFHALDTDIIISHKATEIEKVDAYILPGVGAFPQAIKNIKKYGYDSLLNEQVLCNSKPYLGICLGMQLLSIDSEEQEFTEGLGWLDSHVISLNPDNGLSIPHVGWNELKIKSNNQIFNNMGPSPNYYFDHSFHFVTSEKKIITATCNYGEEIIAAIRKENIFAVQFHPEKSQRNGLKFLRNFINYVIKK